MIHHLFVLAVALLSPAGQLGVSSPLPGALGELASQAAIADSSDDGPHVHWQNDTSAVVFYLCDGGVVTRAFNAGRPIRFTGFCHDTTTEYVVRSERPKIGPHLFADVTQIFAVSDVHGEYERLIELLVNAGVIDDDLHWSWDDGHLVVLGDVFDRGDKVTECLWLIYRLEQEARRFGGRVHYLLGNHELMVMRGDKRYVNEKYLKGIVRRTRIKLEDLYSPDMELGSWLRTKHVAVKLNRLLFVHGGISPDVVARGYSLKTINEAVRANVDIRSSTLAFSDTAKFLFGSWGPLWYRGYHYEMEERYPKTTMEMIAAILSFYDAEAIVVGHTEVGQLAALYDGSVFAVDVPVEELGSLQGLLWKEGKFYRVSGTGRLEPMRLH